MDEWHVNLAKRDGFNLHNFRKKRVQPVTEERRNSFFALAFLSDSLVTSLPTRTTTSRSIRQAKTCRCLQRLARNPAPQARRRKPEETVRGCVPALAELCRGF